MTNSDYSVVVHVRTGPHGRLSWLLADLRAAVAAFLRG